MNSSTENNQIKNTPIYVTMYLFIALFLCMLGYFVYYVYAQSPEDINNSYNPRQETLAAKVIRGSILSADGDVLAKTQIDNSGNETRYYPYGPLFAHVVGYTGKGKLGIESQANISLLSSNAYIGEKITKEINSEKNIGDNVITTLEVDLQKAAYDALGIYKGAIVAADAKTGRILAMVSNPGFDPNTIVRDWDDLNAMTATSPLMNRATSGLYPPGSTFKIVTLLEYFRENSDTAGYHYNCNGHYDEDGIRVNCYHGSVHGAVDLKRSFAKSCNASFANIGSSLNPRRFRNTAEDFLFNEDMPVRFYMKKSAFEYDNSADTEAKLHTAIGQGKTLITPMHLNMITACIANGGVLKKPYLIDRIESYDNTIVKQYKSEDYKRLLKTEEAKFLSDYMAAVVQEGTGSKLKDLPYSVAGKTGSAEYGTTKGDSHAWFTGFSNVEEPELVVTVLVEGAGSGSDYAVPMARRVFDAYYAR